MAFLIKTSRNFLWLLLVGLGLCQVAILLKLENPRIAFLENLASPLSAMAILALLLSLVQRSALGAILSVALAISLYWPIAALPIPEASAGHASGVDKQELKIVSANLWAHAWGSEETLRRLMESDADIIGLIEAKRFWPEQLAALFQRYPYKVECRKTIPNCEAVLLSRLPIAHPFSGYVEGKGPVMAGAEIEWGEKRFTILVTHIAWPFTKAIGGAESAPLPEDLPKGLQSEQAAALARFANSLPKDLIVMGDFNSAPWSRMSLAFQKTTDLRNPKEGVATWPSWFPWPFALPIDYILARGHLEVREFQALPKTDSDHHPIEATIAWVE